MSHYEIHYEELCENEWQAYLYLPYCNSTNIVGSGKSRDEAIGNLLINYGHELNIAFVKG